MLAFWLIAAAMAVLAAALIALPLWFERPGSAVSQDEINKAIFRDRLAELESERSEGRIDDTQYRQLRTELERILLLDVAQPSGQPRQKSILAAKLAVLLAVSVPLLAVVYYYGSAYRGEVAGWIALQRQMEGIVSLALKLNQLPQESRQDPAGFTRVLQARLLKKGMNDPDDLYLLGGSYLQLGRLREALSVLGRAYELAPQRPDILLAYAQAMILTQDESLSETGVQLLHGVLEVNPDHQGALMLLGLGAFNSGAFEQAVQVWQRLLAMLDPASEGARLVRDGIARAETLLAGRAETEKPASDSAAATGPRITVTVELAPALKMRLSPQDTLFIFAKAASGPSIPVAAVQQPVQDFPVQVMLDDSQAMLPSMKLSNFQQVVVSARISKAGSATAQAGDLQGSPVTLSVRNGPQSVSLLIDQVVQ